MIVYTNGLFSYDLVLSREVIIGPPNTPKAIPTFLESFIVIDRKLIGFQYTVQNITNVTKESFCEIQ